MGRKRIGASVAVSLICMLALMCLFLPYPVWRNVEGSRTFIAPIIRKYELRRLGDTIGEIHKRLGPSTENERYMYVCFGSAGTDAEFGRNTIVFRLDSTNHVADYLAIGWEARVDDLLDIGVRERQVLSTLLAGSIRHVLPEEIATLEDVSSLFAAATFVHTEYYVLEPSGWSALMISFDETGRSMSVDVGQYEGTPF